MQQTQMIQHHHTEEETGYIGMNYATVHEQDSDSKYYDDTALERVVETVNINGVEYAISRTRIMSLSQSLE